MHETMGFPPRVESFLGIDAMGRGCCISPTVSVFRPPNRHPQAGIFLGDGVLLFDNVRLLLGEADTRLALGHRVIINVGCYISGEGGLTIDEDVLIGPHVRLLSAGHAIHGGDPVVERNPITRGEIRVGRGAWIAGGATVLEGVTIGEGAVVGAGSVVTSSVPAFAVVVGNPARIACYRRGHASDGSRWRQWFRPRSNAR